MGAELQSPGLRDLLLTCVHEGLHEEEKPQCAGSHTTTSCRPPGTLIGVGELNQKQLALKVVSCVRDNKPQSVVD